MSEDLKNEFQQSEEISAKLARFCFLYPVSSEVKTSALARAWASLCLTYKITPAEFSAMTKLLDEKYREAYSD